MKDYVLLAAGKGTRLWPITERIPKTMVRIIEKPMLEWIVEAIYPDARKIIIVVKEFREVIQKHFAQTKYADKIEYVEQREIKGTGDAVKSCQKNVETEEFVVIYADGFYDPSAFQIITKQKAPFVFGKNVEDGSSFGVLIEKNGKLVEIKEKPKIAKNVSVYTGIFAMPRSFFSFLENLKPSPRGEIEVTDAINVFCKNNEVDVISFNGFWTDVGFFWNLLEANQYALEHLMPAKIEGELDKRVDVNGKLFVGKGAKVVAPCRIDGNVYIGENCWVGPFTLLKDCTIESNCGIGSSEVKRSVIMRETKAYHFTHLADCVVCEDVNFGAGAHSANLRLDKRDIPVNIKGERVNSGKRKLGCVIGEKTNLGCNAVIAPGILIGSNAVVYPNVFVKKNVESGEIVKKDG